MSLQIWLPLNGNLHNQGLLDTIPVVTGTTSFTNGKIGQALNCNGSSFWTVSGINLSAEASICCWKKTSTANKMSWVLESNASSVLNLYESSIYTLNTGDGNNNPFKNKSGNTIAVLTDGLWHHFAVTFGSSIAKLYIDGVYAGTATTFRNPTTTNKSIKIAGGYSGSHTYDFNGQINDFRVYDHCLSAKEVEEISKGLILHYKLDQNLNVLNNCYSYPTFNTSSANGGWSHWGQSGSNGTYGQNTDKQYIFDKTNTYSHWWANSSTATGHYLLYQSPAFDGGYRSLQAILKEQNGLPITEEIVYPAWNARNGGAPSNKWTSISPLGDGFYLCKCEGISQDGSNDLVGLYLKPGYKVYCSEAYLENNREICSDIYAQTNLTTIYDSSGYNNNGTIVGSLEVITPSPRYSYATKMANGQYIRVNNRPNACMPKDAITVNLWQYATSWSNPISCTEGGGWNFENSSGIRFPVYISGVGYKVAQSSITPASAQNAWHMLTGTMDKDNIKIYYDGEEVGTVANGSTNGIGYANNYIFIGAEAQGDNVAPAGSAYAGNLSDVRIYATALTPEQIKELYNISATIDNDGNIYARELVE